MAWAAYLFEGLYVGRARGGTGPGCYHFKASMLHEQEVRSYAIIPHLQGSETAGG